MTRIGEGMFLLMVVAVSAMYGIALVAGAADLLVNLR